MGKRILEGAKLASAAGHVCMAEIVLGRMLSVHGSKPRRTELAWSPVECAKLQMKDVPIERPTRSHETRVCR